MNNREEIKDKIIKWDISSISELIDSDVPFSYLTVKNKTDILLNLIIKKNLILFKRLLDKNFPLHNDDILYLHYIVEGNDLDMLKYYLSKCKDEEYINRKNIKNNNAIHIASEKRVSQKIIVELYKNKCKLDVVNNENKNCINCILQNYNYLDDEVIEIIKQNKVLLLEKDNNNISGMDVINSKFKDIKNKIV